MSVISCVMYNALSSNFFLGGRGGGNCALEKLSIIINILVGGVVTLVVTGHLDEVSNTRKGDFILYCSSVVFINSIINPVIYAFKIPAIRRRFRSVFCANCLGRGLTDDTQASHDGKTGLQLPIKHTTQKGRENVDILSKCLSLLYSPVHVQSALF